MYTPVKDNKDLQGAGTQGQEGSKPSHKLVRARASMNTPGSTPLLRPSLNNPQIPPPLTNLITPARTNKLSKIREMFVIGNQTLVITIEQELNQGKPANMVIWFGSGLLGP